MPLGYNPTISPPISSFKWWSFADGATSETISFSSV
jgi:hypothetical protein